jgi:predicted RNA binding protein YcfA (HicA-like mRNA interferase family)
MSSNIPILTSKEIERILKKIGFELYRQTGSHRIFVKDNFQVVVPHHSKDLKKGTLFQIIKGTGLSIDEFKMYI